MDQKERIQLNEFKNVNNVNVDTSIKVNFTTNDNLTLDASADGTFRFTVTGPDGLAPKITVEELLP